MSYNKTANVAKRCFILCLLVRYLFLSVEMFADEKSNLLFDIPNKTIRVGLCPLKGIYNVKNDEPYSGYDYDYIQQLKRYSPWAYEYSDPKHTQSDLLLMLKDGKLDLLTHVEKTPELENQLAFSEYPMGQMSVIITVKSDNRHYHTSDYKNWNGIQVGFLKGTSYEKILAEYAHNKGFTWHAVPYDDADQMYRDLQQGSIIDAVLSDNMRLLHKESILEQLKTVSFHIAVRKDNTVLLAELNSAMKQLNLDSPTFQETLWNQYFLCKDRIVYTKSEQEFIRQTRKSSHKFKAVLNPDRYPISCFSNDRHSGFLKDIADEIIRRSELNIELQPIQTPDEYHKACQDPAIDIIFDVQQDLRNAEKNGLILSQPYVTLSVSMLCNRGKESRMKNIALVDRYQISEDIRSKLPADAVIHSCQSTQEAISLVLQGKCDTTVLYTSTTESVVRDNPKVLLESNLLYSLHVKLAVGIRDSRNPLLASIICKSVDGIDEDFINQARMNRSVDNEPTFSFSQVVRRFPMIVLGVPCLVLLILCVILWKLLIARKNAYRLGIVFSNLPFRYFIVDTSGTILQFNYGNELKHADFHTLDDITDANIRVPIKELVAQTMESGKTMEGIYQDAGRTRLSMTSSLPVSMFGRPTVIGVSQDITELRNIRDEARRNEEYFRFTLRSIGDGVMTTDQKGNIVMLNPVAERMIGVETKNVIGQPHTKYFKIFSMEDETLLESPVFRTLWTRHTIELSNPVDLQSVTEEKRYHIAIHSSPIHDEQGTVIGAILVFRDITMEYNRHREIQEELAHWEAIATNMEIYRFRYNPTTHEVIAASKGLSHVWPIENGIATPATEWICSEDIDQWMRSYTDIVEGKTKEEFFEFRVRQNGKMRYFRGYIRGAEEPRAELTGFIQEITRSKEALKKQNAILNLLMACIEAMPVTFFIKSANDDFRYLLCNQRYARLLGKEIEEVIGRTDAELFYRPEDAKHFRHCDQEVIDGGKPLQMNETVSYADGNIRHFMTVKVPVTDMDGMPALLGMSLDETDNFKRRQKLDMVLEDWELASNVAKIASYRLNSKMEILSRTDRITEFWPVCGDKPLDPEKYLHPDDVEPYRNMYTAVFEGKQEEASMLCRIPQSTGTRFMRLFIKRNANRPDEISGLIQDITEKIAEHNKREALLSMWKNVIDSMPIMFVVKNVDDDFRYLQANGNFSSLFGHHAQEIVGRKEKEFFVNPKDAEQIYTDDLQVVKSGKRQDFIETIHDHNGMLRQFQAVKLPMVNESGQRVLISMALEITEAQEASEVRRIISSAFEKLFVSNDLAKDLQKILKDICDFIGFDRAYIACVEEKTNSLRLFTTYVPEGEQPMFDPASFHIDHVENLSRFAGPESSIGSGVFHVDFDNANDMELIQYHIPSFLEKASEFDIRGIHMNCVSVNRKIWGMVGFITLGRKVKSLSDNEKRLLSLAAHIVELAITRKRTTIRLENALRDALAADKAKSFFLSSMSHEIRTPLNAVIGFTDLLKDNELDRETRMEYLGAVSKASQALLVLLNDILDLSKLTSGRGKTVPILTNVQSFICEMDSIFRQDANQKNLALIFTAFGIPDIYIDQLRLRQILFNLIGNAVKFTSQGEIIVSMSFKKSDNYYGVLTLKVSDTGKGIDPEDQKNLFEPFVQLKHLRGTNASETGTGLGLPIVKKIVEHDGGTLTLDSKVGRGSTFTIVWPKVKYKPSDILFMTRSDNSAVLPFEEKLSDPEVFIPNVLVVDDSIIVLDIISRMLKGLKIPFSVAFSGKEALEQLEKQSFDIIMTDILMPEMRGDELASTIRSQSKYKQMRIVAMSGEKEAVMYDKTLFDCVMIKPIVRKSLCECIFGNVNK